MSVVYLTNFMDVLLVMLWIQCTIEASLDVGVNLFVEFKEPILVDSFYLTPFSEALCGIKGICRQDSLSFLCTSGMHVLGLEVRPVLNSGFHIVMHSG
ncbi:MAG: hypothetical protein VXZ58_02770, partial [Actinomycetota bacterium]|nr:hypothetical protein [Actinomycetota bacterium]